MSPTRPARGASTTTNPAALVLAARLSGQQIVINGHALSPPLSVVAAIPADPEPRSRCTARRKQGRTTWTVGGH